VLKIENTVLIVIDAQTRLINAMFEKEPLMACLARLVQGVQVLGLPIIATEQNPKGLGPTLPEISSLVPGFQPVVKVSWSCCQENNFQRALAALGRRQVLVTGVEAHVCVYQTAMDLLGLGYEVQMVADCVGSRTARNRDIALSRTVSEGAKLTSTEMALFELLPDSQDPRFKEILKIVK
jgi:nicotinamidase-related amidase